MSSGALTRDAIVRGPDDLGEREKLAKVWTTDADQPYPAEAVHKRSERLRERLQLKRGGLILMLLVGITGGFGIAG